MEKRVGQDSWRVSRLEQRGDVKGGNGRVG